MLAALLGFGLFLVVSSRGLMGRPALFFALAGRDLPLPHPIIMSEIFVTL